MNLRRLKVVYAVTPAPKTSKETALRAFPKTRAECEGGERPCPFVSCRHHLLLDIAEDGRLFMSHGASEHDEEATAKALEEMPFTCSLDAAAEGARTEEEIATLMDVHQVRICQISTDGQRRLRRKLMAE